jgi:hypothetical protein
MMGRRSRSAGVSALGPFDGAMSELLAGTGDGSMVTAAPSPSAPTPRRRYRRHYGERKIHPKLAITYRLANQAKIDNRHRIVCRLSPHSDQ